MRCDRGATLVKASAIAVAFEFTMSSLFFSRDIVVKSGSTTATMLALDDLESGQDYQLSIAVASASADSAEPLTWSHLNIKTLHTGTILRL